jgi:hypothetical protein
MKPKVIALLAFSLAPFAAFAQPQSGGGYHGGPAHTPASHVGSGYRPGPAVSRSHVGAGVVASSRSGWRPPLHPSIAYPRVNGRPYFAGHYYGNGHGHGYSSGYYGRYYGYPRYSYYRPYPYYGGFYAGLALGTFVAALPYAYDTFWFGGVPYYYYDNTYYLWNRDASQYEVVERPSNTAPAEDQSGAAPKDIFVYPAKGQSEEQQKTDRYECHRWAVDKTGFDPTSGVPAQEGDNDQYRRAEAACLTGRGYSVK